MKENLIMNTVYNVLMDEGFRPQRMKPIPEETFIVFKSRGLSLTIVADGDDIINITAGIEIPYTKEFGRLDMYERVNVYKCMRVDAAEFANNKKTLRFLISFQTMVHETKNIKSILEYGIDTITNCIEDVID